MARQCPVCGKGMFTRKKLIQHIRRYHPDYYNKYIKNGSFVMTQWCKGLAKNKMKLPEICRQILRNKVFN